MVTVARTRWGRSGFGAVLALGMASAAFAGSDARDPFEPGLIPGTPLSEEELSSYEGRGAEATLVGNTRPESGPAGVSVPLHEASETRSEAAIERLENVEDRLADGIGSNATGAIGAVGDGRINATDIESRMSDRLDALVDHAFEAETRTHWTIWH